MLKNEFAKMICVKNTASVSADNVQARKAQLIGIVGRSAKAAKELVSLYLTENPDAPPQNTFQAEMVEMRVWPIHIVGNPKNKTAKEKPYGVVAGKKHLIEYYGKDKAEDTAEWYVLCAFDAIRIAHKRMMELQAALAGNTVTEEEQDEAKAEGTAPTPEVVQVATLTVDELVTGIGNIINNPPATVAECLDALKTLISVKC